MCYYCNLEIGENPSYMYPIPLYNTNLMIFTGYINGLDPYLKIIKIIKENNYIIGIKEISRLNMLYPKYITGLDENYILTNEELELIYNTLNSKHPNISRDTAWLAAAEYLNKNLNIDFNFDINYIPNIIPNYLILKKG